MRQFAKWLTLSNIDVNYMNNKDRGGHMESRVLVQELDHAGKRAAVSILITLSLKPHGYQ